MRKVNQIHYGVSKGRFPREASISVAGSGPVRVSVCKYVCGCCGGSVGKEKDAGLRVKRSAEGKF